MVQTPTESIPPVIRDLMLHPQNYAFTQAVRLLRLWADSHSAQKFDGFLHEKLRFRPALNLAFAVSDIEQLELVFADKATVEATNEKSPFDKARITATFLGLYGACSPLPKFYTEQLLDERVQDSSVTRDFLDIFNNQFFQLHLRLCTYIHPLYSGVTANDPKTEKMLMALASFGVDALRERLPFERMFLLHASFFSQAMRTASGLKTILANASGCQQTAIVCNVARLPLIPEAQRLCLGLFGNVLGEEATLGDAVPCYEGKIIIEFNGLDEKAFRALLPGSLTADIIHALISNYCRHALEYAVSAQLVPQEARALCLGGIENSHFASLGRDAWVGFGGTKPAAPLPSVRANFPSGFA